MINLRQDIGHIHLYCRFSRTEQLVKLLEYRLPHFTDLINGIAKKIDQKVLWTNQHGGIVREANVSLDNEGRAQLAAQLSCSEEFDFFTWTPWKNDIYPSISFGRHQLMGKNNTHINFNFPDYYYLQDIDIKRIIDDLLNVEDEKDIGFTAQVRLRTNRDEPPFAYEGFNIYHYSNKGQFSEMGVEEQLNPDLSESTYIDPCVLAQEQLPKFRDDLN